jgi:hypothetical protein
MEDDVKSYGEAVERVSQKDKHEIAKTMAIGFLQTVSANLDNEELSDEEFRWFMRNSMAGIRGFGYKELEKG